MFKGGKAGRLEITITSRASVSADITLRFLTREGQTIVNQTTVAGSAFTTSTFRVSEMPILLTVGDRNDAFDQGECFVTVQLLLNGDVIFEFCSGYVYGHKRISWPSTSSPDIMPHRGVIRRVTGTNPAAGSDFSQTVPAGRVWNIHAMSFFFTTSATVANRRVHIEFAIAGGPSLDIYSADDQAASLSLKYTVAGFTGAHPQSNDNDHIIMLPPNIWLPDGSTIITDTLNIQVGDDYTAPLFLVEEFLNTE